MDLPFEHIELADFLAWESGKPGSPPGAMKSYHEALSLLQNAVTARALLRSAEITLPSAPAALLTHPTEGGSGWALACMDGTVLFGWAGNDGGFQQRAVHRLNLFLADQDEITAIASVARHLSRSRDLLVGIRRWVPGGKDPSVRLYRASVGFRTGDVVVRPDQELGSGVAWPPLDPPSDTLPSWLQFPSLALPPGHDVSASPPQVDVARVRGLRADRGNPLCTALHPTGLLVGTDAGQIVHLSSTGGEVAVARLDAPVLSLAIAAGDGVDWVAAGLGDQRMVCLRFPRVQVPQVEEAWRFLTRDTVRAIALLPRPGAEPPDVLAAFRSGVFRRYRYVEPTRLEDLFAREVAAVAGRNGLAILGDWVRFVEQEAEKEKDSNGRWGLMLVLLGEAFRDPVGSRPWHDDLGQLVSRPLFRELGSLLGRNLALRIRALESRPTDAAWEILERIHRHAGLDLRDRLHQEMRAVFGKRNPDGVADGSVFGRLLAASLIRPPEWWDWADGQRPAPPGDAHAALHFLAARALQRHLLKDYLVLERFQPRGLACFGRDTNAQYVVMGRDGFRWGHLDGGRFHGQPEKVPLPDGPVPRNLRSMEMPPFGDVAVAGLQDGRAVLLLPDGKCEELGAVAGAVCRAAMPLVRDGAPGRFAVVWNQERRSFLEVFEARPDTKELFKRVFYEPLFVPLPVDADAVSLGGDRFRLAIGDESTNMVHLLDFDLGKGGIEKRDDLRLQSAPKCVRFQHRSDGLHLLTGTRNGMLWSHRVSDLHVDWTFLARRVVRSLEVGYADTSGDAAVSHLCAVACDPQDAFVVDADGRQVWHRRFTRALRAIRFLRGPVLRLMLASTEGWIAVYREAGQRPQQADFLARYAALRPFTPEDAELADQVRRGIHPASRPADVLRDDTDGKVRRTYLRRLALEEVSKEDRDFVSDHLRFREAAEMLRVLPGGAASGWFDAILEAMPEDREPAEHGDDSVRARMAAWAEALRYLLREEPARDRLATLLRHIPRDLHGNEWIQLEAARGWWDALHRNLPGKGVDPGDMLLGSLHEIPLVLGLRLQHMVRPEALAVAVRRLQDVVSSVDGGHQIKEPHLRYTAPGFERSLAETWQQVGDPGGAAPTLAGGLARILALLAEETASAVAWDRVVDLIRYARRLKSGVSGPVASLVKLPATLAPRVLPDDTWPLDRQIAWLRTAIEPERDPDDPLEDGVGPWERWQRFVAVALVRRCREIARRRVEVLEWTTRALPETLRVARPRPERVELDLSLRPDGTRPLRGVKVEARLLAGTPARRVGEPVVFERLVFQEGEPAHRAAIGGRCRATDDAFSVEVEVWTGSHRQGIWRWPVDFPAPTAARPPAVAPFPHGVPGLFQALVSHLQTRHRGVLAVILDDVLDPGAVARAIGPAEQTLWLDLDVTLRHAGPGARYPDALGRRTLERHLSGCRTVVNESAPEDPPPDLRRVVLWPNAEILDRILASTDLTRDLVATLRGHTSGPAWILLVSSDHATALHRASGGSLEILAHNRLPGRLPPGLSPGGETQAWVARAAELDVDKARQAVEQVGGDLRVLASWLARRAADRTRSAQPTGADMLAFARADLRRLRPEDLLSVLVLAGATVEIPLSDLKPGMMPVAHHWSHPRGKASQRKLLLPAELPATRTGISRVRRDQASPASLRIYGLRPDRSPTFLADRAALAPFASTGTAALQRLEGLGFVDHANGIYLVRRIYQAAVDDVLQREGNPRAAFHALSGEGGLLDAVQLASLAELDGARCEALLGSTSLLRSLRAVGRAWLASAPGSEGRVVSSADAHALFGAFVGEGDGETATISLPDETPGLARLKEGLARGRCTLIGVTSGGGNRPRSLLAIVPQAPHPRYPEVSAAFREMLSAEAAGSATLVCVGPGVQEWPDPPAGSGVAVLREEQVRVALRSEHPQATFWSMVRLQVGLSAVNPFSTQGALPPGSPMFVGREDLVRNLLAQLTQRNVLIVGARQIGKTSLLNRILWESLGRGDVDAFRFDCQGKSNSEALEFLAERELETRGIRYRQGLSALEMLHLLRDWSVKRGRKALFFFNEIDALLGGDQPFVEGLRGLVEGGDARVLMVGYTVTTRAMQDVNGPMYHFTNGLGGEKAVVLLALAAAEARQLMGRLVEPPLGLTWDSERDREIADDLILLHSHGVPWVIQKVCSDLVNRLDKDRRFVLRADDARAVLAVGRAEPFLLDLLDRTDFATLVNRPGDEAVKWAALALLRAVAVDRYFAPAAEIQWESLPETEPGVFGFTSDAARSILLREADALLSRKELDLVEVYLKTFPVEVLFEGLCLTLILIPVPRTDLLPDRFAFLNHIYPLEMRLARDRNRSPVDQLFEALVSLLDHLKIKGA